MNLSILNHPLAYWLRPETKRAILAELNKLVSEGKCIMTQDTEGNVIINPSRPHYWIPSTLGHGGSMCKWCCITDLEAGALGCMNHCNSAPEIEFDYKPATTADEQADQDAYREEQG